MKKMPRPGLEAGLSLYLHGETFGAAGAPALEQKSSWLVKSKACTTTGQRALWQIQRSFTLDLPALLARGNLVQLLLRFCALASARESKHEIFHRICFLILVYISSVGQSFH